MGEKLLSRAVTELLPSLGMPSGAFASRLVPVPASHALGSESVVFEIQLNTGLDARPLARVASGGELSRLMLALKVVLAQHDAVPTLVFDEVDQGIGGEVGGRVGEALAAVARGGGRQALVITHLPQIAAYADHHLVVAKGAQAGVATRAVPGVQGGARRRGGARVCGGGGRVCRTDPRLAKGGRGGAARGRGGVEGVGVGGGGEAGGVGAPKGVAKSPGSGAVRNG